MEKIKDKGLDNIMTAIEKWQKKNDVCFLGGFVSFDEKKMENNEDDATKDTRIIMFGNKESLKIISKDITNIIKKEKGDFINI